MVCSKALASRWLMTACIALSLSCGEQVVVREAPAQCGNGTIGAMSSATMVTASRAMRAPTGVN